MKTVAKFKEKYHNIDKEETFALMWGRKKNQGPSAKPGGAPSGQGNKVRLGIFSRLRRPLKMRSPARGTPLNKPPLKEPQAKELSRNQEQKITVPAEKKKKREQLGLTPEGAKRALFVQSAEFTGDFYYQAALRLWSLLIASMVIDVGILWYAPALPQLRPFAFVLDAGAILLMAVGLLSLKRDSLLDMADNIRNLQGKVIKSGRASTILVILFVLGTMLEIVLKAGSAGIVPLLFTLVLIAFGLPSVIRNIKERLRKNLALKSDLLIWVPYVNRQTFWINTVPLFCVRAISALGVAKSLMAQDALTSYLPYLGASLVFLFILRPEKAHFIIHCPRCAAWTSRALKETGYCPDCARDKFLQVPEAHKPLESIPAPQQRKESLFQKVKAGTIGRLRVK